MKDKDRRAIGHIPRRPGPGSPICGNCRGFTIIELIVGFAVLTILVTLLATAFANFSRATSASSTRIETGKQARGLFDRMAYDLSSAVTTGGMRIDIQKNRALPGGTASNNDVLVMLTDAKTSDPGARLARVGYGVGSHVDRSRNHNVVNTLLRYVEPFGWDDDTTLIEIASDQNAQPMAPGILRFELAFVDSRGEILASPPSSTDPLVLKEFYGNIKAVICTVATLDADTLQKLTDAQRDTIRDLLPDAVNGQAPLNSWQSVDLDSLPQPVVEGLRFHQRYFPIR